MAQSQLLVIIKAKDQASRVLQDVNKSLRQYNLSLSKIGIGVAALGGAIVGAMIWSARSFGQAADQLKKMGLETGFSSEMLQGLRYAALSSGSSMDILNGALTRFADFMGEAATGSGTANEALKKLGLSFRDLKGLAPDEQFREIVRALMAIEDPFLRAKLAQDIFGTSASLLLPILENLNVKMDEARERGWIIDEEDLRKAAEFDKALKGIGLAFEMLKTQVGATIGPILTPFLDWIGDVVWKIGEWAKTQPALTTALITFAGVISGLLAALGVLGAAWGPITLGVKLAGAVIGGLAGLVNPVTLAFTLLGLSIWYLVGNWEEIKKGYENIIKWFIDRLNDLVNGINALINAWNSLPFGNIPMAPTVSGGWNQGGLTDRTNDILERINYQPGMAPGSVINNITVQGSLMTESDLKSTIREGLFDIQFHNVNTGL